MKLLVITQKVDRQDSALGFFHRWLVEFANHFDSITVICLEKGAYELPANVRVLSLGKEKGESRLKYTSLLYRYVLQERNNYDAVFVHMNPIYVVMVGWIWKLLNKPVFLWYVHRSVDLKLRIASKFADTIFTAAKESCRIKSQKIKIVGHGIDTERYAKIIRASRLSEDPVRIIHVGRITKIKNCDTLVAAAAELKRTWSKKFEVIFIGEPVTPEDWEYKKMLDGRIKEAGLGDIVKFSGVVPNDQIDAQYAQADASVNLTPTGGIDKSVLEALSSGVPTFFSNDAFLETFAPYENIFHIAYKDAGMLAEKIKNYFNRADTSAIESELRDRVLEKFSVTALITKLSNYIHDSSR